jgi:hypothetical protein
MRRCGSQGKKRKKNEKTKKKEEKKFTQVKKRTSLQYLLCRTVEGVP